MAVAKPGEEGQLIDNVSGTNVVQLSPIRVDERMAQTEASVYSVLANVEAKEAEPELQLTVAASCNNPNGKYIGLSSSQRGKLGVVVGDTVELFDSDGKSLGLFTVGGGLNALKDKPESFSANGVEIGSKVIVRKPKTSEILEKIGIPFSVGIEKSDKHEARKGKIESRFGKQGYNGDTYIVVPTALAKSFTDQKGTGITTSKPTVAAIALGKVKVNGVEKEIPVVPAGAELSFTTSAGNLFNIPGDAKNAKYSIERGTLVVELT